MTGTALAIDVGAHFVFISETGGTLTDIIHPLLDDQPNAIFHVTQNYNSPGTPGTYNDHVIGVRFNDDLGWWAIYNQDAGGQLLGAGFNIWIPPVGGSSFVHTATAGNTTNNWTFIDSPLTNGNPDAILHGTQNFNPGGGGGVFNHHAVGVWYYGTISRWAIFNQDEAAMPVGASFNVTVLPDDPTAAVHTAVPANTTGAWTSINHPLTNNNPNAIVSITQNWNPGGVGGVYNDHAVGVMYQDGIAKWTVFNQDGAPMPDGASFNVSAPSLESTVFVHSADSGNITGPVTRIDHPLSNNNPNAIVSITQNWNPGGVGGTFNDHALGVFYDSSNWTIFNQDSVDMPEGASFNVSIPAVDASTFTHTATALNSSGHATYLDNPVTDDDPDAIVHVTQNWNPPGTSGVFNDHAIGLFFNEIEGKWAILNQDFSTMPVGASFNISIPVVDATSFVHTATVGNTTHDHTVIDHPFANDNPDAIVRVTQNLNPGGGFGVINDLEIGVWYNGSAWAIFNQDGVPMPEHASFNVTVVDPPLFSDGFESGDTSAWSAAVP